MTVPARPSLRQKLQVAFSSIPKLSKRARWIAGLLVLLIIVGGISAYKFIYVPSQAPAEATVQTSVVRQGSLVISASGTGTLIAKDEVDLAFETGGKVTSINVKVGDQVKAGDVLATVDDTDLKIQYAQARRALQDLTSPSAIAAAKAGIATAESDLTSAIQHLAYIISPNVLHWEDEIKKAQATLEDAQAAADASPTDKDAQTALVIAKAGLEHAQAGLKGAQYSYTETYIKNNFTVTTMDQSSHHMIKYVAEPSEADILEARAAVAEAQAGVTEANDLYAALTGGELPDDATGDSLTQLEQARLDVEDAKSKLDGASIVATIPGTVMSVNTSVGETANSGSTMMTISDLSQPYLQVFLDESDWSNVKVGAEADITFDILPDETFTGKVMQVDPGLYTEGNSSVVRAYVQLADSDAARVSLPLGTSASVDVIGARAENALLVPVEALHEVGNGQYTVFVMVDGVPKLRKVEVGIQDLINAVVTSGLQAGDVVTTGVTDEVMTGPMIIETRAVTKIYGMGDATVAALRGVSIAIDRGEFVAIMGPSGSGKSTLMHILGCLSQPTDGEYILDGEDVSRLDMVRLAGVRNRKIGFIFQSYNLLARTSALRNVTLPLLYNHDSPKTQQEGDEKARLMLDRVGLGDRVLHQPHELSGGQQQRVAIARALINDPVMVIADEPTGNLDSRSGEEIMNILHKLHSQGTTIVMVTHDPGIAAHTQRTIHLMDGLVADVIHNGRHHSAPVETEVSHEAL